MYQYCMRSTSVSAAGLRYNAVTRKTSRPNENFTCRGSGCLQAVLFSSYFVLAVYIVRHWYTSQYHPSCNTSTPTTNPRRRTLVYTLERALSYRGRATRPPSAATGVYKVLLHNLSVPTEHELLINNNSYPQSQQHLVKRLGISGSKPEIVICMYCAPTPFVHFNHIVGIILVLGLPRHNSNSGPVRFFRLLWYWFTPALWSTIVYNYSTLATL
ncbi:hypothetical protein F4777DRAFT_551015 [Nemania sp. FL0916]|nr:hypothetical protein F4777DRAFT_551015 [Nemania sp. FL0916]